MDSKDHKLSIRRQCVLLKLVRSNLYYDPKGESAEKLWFMKIIDKQFLKTPGTGRFKWCGRATNVGSTVCDGFPVLSQILFVPATHRVVV